MGSKRRKSEDRQEIILELRSKASEEYKANVVRMGIPEECSIGVSNADIKKLAGRAGKSKEMAHDLREKGNKAQKWVAKEVIKELEKMVQAEGRTRLISASTRMGQQAMVTPGLLPFMRAGRLYF